ncbi:MAG: ExbD/TolR family protein [bacterium]
MAFNLNKSSTLSDINVTPLVDVMLVLLIIFMVTAPLLETKNQSINLNLPKVKTGQKANINETAIIVSIDKQGVIYLNDSEIQQLNLKKKLEILFSNRSKKEIFLKADSLIPYGNVMRVMDLIRSSGIKKISMVTEPIKRNKSR